METGEVGAHTVAAVKPVEEGLISELDFAITQLQSMEDATVLVTLLELLHMNRLHLAKPIDVQVCLLLFHKSIIIFLIFITLQFRIIKYYLSHKCFTEVTCQDTEDWCTFIRKDACSGNDVKGKCPKTCKSCL